jgi:peroxiredoxin
MNTSMKRLEVAVNVAILCAFLMVAALAAQRFWSASTNARTTSPEIGTKVSLAGVDWSKSDRNLVLALSTTCRFCSQSAPFYKELVPDAEQHGIRVIAVLPQALSESRSYLDGLGVDVQNILQSSLDSVKAKATPTLLIVDKTGTINKAWVGKLESQREKQVIASLQ